MCSCINTIAHRHDVAKQAEAETRKAPACTQIARSKLRGEIIRGRESNDGKNSSKVLVKRKRRSLFADIREKSSFKDSLKMSQKSFFEREIFKLLPLRFRKLSII